MMTANICFHKPVSFLPIREPPFVYAQFSLTGMIPADMNTLTVRISLAIHSDDGTSNRFLSEKLKQKEVSILEQCRNDAEERLFADQSLTLYESLTSDSGLQNILNTAEGIFGNPILISDISFKLIAYTGGLDINDAIWKQIIENGYYPSDYIHDILKNDEQYHKVFGNNLPLILSDTSTPNQFMTKMIVVKGKPVGFSTCLEYNRKITPLDMRLFDVFCKVVGSELRNDENIRQIRSHQYEYFLSEMLSGAVKNGLHRRKAQAGWLKLKRNLYVMAVEFEDEKMRRDYLWIL
jgi:hypothetical protein